MQTQKSGLLISDRYRSKKILCNPNNIWISIFAPCPVKKSGRLGLPWKNRDLVLHRISPHTLAMLIYIVVTFHRKTNNSEQETVEVPGLLRNRGHLVQIGQIEFHYF